MNLPPMARREAEGLRARLERMEAELEHERLLRAEEVRKTPSWPRSWANCNLL